MPVLRLKDITLPLGKKTYVMGILNVTPDSFSDGGLYFDPDSAYERAVLLKQQGVDIIDVGGQSTRPGHKTVPPEEEWERIEPVLVRLKGFDIPVSVDTFYPQVAARALEYGARMINDVSGVVSADMAEVIKRYNAAWVIMHNGGIPEGQWAPLYVHNWLKEAAHLAIELGIGSECICLDPGIGFGKDVRQNHQLILNTASVKVEGFAYLLAASRKRCIKIPAGNCEFNQCDSGTVAAHTIGILGGADIIRAHDGFGGVQAARVADAIRFSDIEG
ncbi:MAG TPA: dihydropteroate synthase [Clostridiales bacterium]|nr:dihydropteroate synthase [Clostridiales bacterium]